MTKAIALTKRRLPESAIAPFLTSLQQKVKEEGIRIGSYPQLMKGVTVSLIGRDEARIRELGDEVSGRFTCPSIPPYSKRGWKVVKEIQGSIVET